MLPALASCLPSLPLRVLLIALPTHRIFLLAVQLQRQTQARRILLLAAGLFRLFIPPLLNYSLLVVICSPFSPSRPRQPFRPRPLLQLLLWKTVDCCHTSLPVLFRSDTNQGFQETLFFVRAQTRPRRQRLDSFSRPLLPTLPQIPPPRWHSLPRFCAVVHGVLADDF